MTGGSKDRRARQLLTSWPEGRAAGRPGVPEGPATCLALRTAQTTGHLGCNCDSEWLGWPLHCKMVPRWRLLGSWVTGTRNAWGWACVSKWSVCPSPNQQFVFVKRSHRTRRLPHTACLSLPLGQSPSSGFPHTLTHQVPIRYRTRPRTHRWQGSGESVGRLYARLPERGPGDREGPRGQGEPPRVPKRASPVMTSLSLC